MNGLTVRQEHDPEKSTLRFGNRTPSANSSVRLNHFPGWRLNDPLNPALLNVGSVGAFPNRLEVARRLHPATLPVPAAASNSPVLGRHDVGGSVSTIQLYIHFAKRDPFRSPLNHPVGHRRVAGRFRRDFARNTAGARQTSSRRLPTDVGEATRLHEDRDLVQAEINALRMLFGLGPE